jgi:hypothetical protein
LISRGFPIISIFFLLFSNKQSKKKKKPKTY